MTTVYKLSDIDPSVYKSVCVKFQGIKVWNSFPISITTLSINAFKKFLKEHYLFQQ